LKRKLIKAFKLFGAVPVMLWLITGNIMANKNELVVTKELGNGLRCAVYEQPDTEVVELRIYVKTGSVYEQEYPGSGISHFLEHLTAEGPTEKRSKKEVDELIEKFGNAFNAYTSASHTCYHITTIRKYYKEALDLLAELVFENKITKEAFKRERGVITREIEKSLEEPGRYLHQLTSENIYKVLPAKYPVIGYLELFKKITMEDIKKYYVKKYAVNNSVVVIGGGVNRKEAVDYIRDRFSKYERSFYSVPAMPDEPPIMTIREKKGFRDIEGKYLNLSWLTIPLSHEDLYALDLLSEILSSGRSSRLNRILKEEKEIVNSVNSYSHTPEYGKGEFTISANFRDSLPREVEKAVLEIIADIQENGVMDYEIERAKKLVLSSYLFRKTSVSGCVSRIGIDMVSTGEKDFSEKYVEGIRKTTAKQVKEAAVKYLSISNYARTLLLPESEKKAFGENEKKKTEEKIEKIILNNGTTVILKNEPGIEVVNYALFLKGGLTYDNLYNTPGLSGFMSSMLARGTRSHTREELNREFEERGASFSVSSGNSTFYIQAASLSDDCGKILDLLYEILYEPEFPEDEIEKVRKFRMHALYQQKDNWQKEAYLNYKENIFPAETAYIYSEIGTTESVKAVDRDLIWKVYNDFVIPDNLVIAVVGDFNESRVKEKIRKTFGKVKRSEKKLPDYESKFIKLESDVYKEYMTGKELSVIFRGFPTVDVYDSKQRAALDIIDTIISGGSYPGGWLHERMRGKELVYVVHAYNQNYLKSGCFTIFAATNPENLKKSLAEFDKAVEELRMGKYTEDDIRKAKDMIETAEKLDNQSPGSRAQSYALNELLGFGYDFDEKYVELIKNVTRKDIEEAVKKYFNQSVTVVTTPKSN